MLTSVYLFLDSAESFLVQTEFPCVALWRPEALDCVARCVYLQRLGVGLPVTRPAWDSNLGPPASKIGS